MINEPSKFRTNGRIGHTKSKNGCLTCKIRRIKCSEEKPQCHRCTSTGRKCDYGKAGTGYDFKSWSRRHPLHASNSSSSSSNGHCASWQSFPMVMATMDSHPAGSSRDCSMELRAFEYFFMRGLLIFPRAVGDRFWTTCILQACHAEPVIWDAVISLSALFEHPQYSKVPVRGLRGAPRDSPGTPARDPTHQQALVWYSRSLSRLRRSIEKGVASDLVVLISCILYICIELLQDNVTEVLQLYHHGTGIISKRRRSSVSDIIQGYIVPLFSNFSGVAACMEYIPLDKVVLPQHLDTLPTSCDWFSNLEEAELALFRFLSRGVTHSREAESVMLFEKNVSKQRIAQLEAEKNFLQTELDKWYTRFCELGIHLALESNDIPTTQRYVIAKLLQAHAVFHASIATSMVMSEMANDELTADYEAILRYGRVGIEATRYPDGTQPPFSLENSMALGLFVCATKCRDYRIRHQALDMLQEAPKVQGLCNAATHASMAAKVVSLEEAGLEMEQGQGMFIPEERRIAHFCVTSMSPGEKGDGTWMLQYTRKIPTGDGYRIVTDWSPF